MHELKVGPFTGNISHRENRFIAFMFASIEEDAPVVKIGVRGICEVFDRSIFETTVADFWQDRLDQLIKWKSNPPVPGTLIQDLAINGEIRKVKRKLAKLSAADTEETAIALNRARNAENVYLFMESGLALKGQGNMSASRYARLPFDNKINSFVLSGVILNESGTVSRLLVNSPNVIQALTATHVQQQSLAEMVLDGGIPISTLSPPIRRLVDIYTVEWHWHYYVNQTRVKS